MTQSPFPNGRDQHDHHIVLAPRVTDAIGQTLRGAFGGHIATSGEFADLLAQLNTVRPTRH